MAMCLTGYSDCLTAFCKPLIELMPHHFEKCLAWSLALYIYQLHTTVIGIKVELSERLEMLK